MAEGCLQNVCTPLLSRGRRTPAPEPGRGTGTFLRWTAPWPCWHSAARESLCSPTRRNIHKHDTPINSPEVCENLLESSSLVPSCSAAPWWTVGSGGSLSPCPNERTGICCFSPFCRPHFLMLMTLPAAKRKLASERWWMSVEEMQSSAVRVRSLLLFW